MFIVAYACFLSALCLVAFMIGREYEKHRLRNAIQIEGKEISVDLKKLSHKKLRNWISSVDNGDGKIKVKPIKAIINHDF